MYKLKSPLETLVVLLWSGWQLFLRDFRRRYRLAYLGYFWAFSRVVITSAPFVLVGHQFGFEGQNAPIPYALYVFMGVFLYQVFWDALFLPLRFGRRSRKIMHEVYIRPEAILLAGCCNSLFNAALSLFPLIVLLFVFQFVPALTIVLMLLVGIPALLLFGLAIGIWLIPINMVYLDFRYGVASLSTVLIFSAPIVYVMPKDGILAAINLWNPLTYLITVPRTWALVGLNGNDWILVLIAVLSLLVLLFSLRFYRHVMQLAMDLL